MGSFFSKSRRRRSTERPPDPSELMDKPVTMATKNMSKTEKMSDKEVLFNTLEELSDEEFKNFKWYLRQHKIPGTSRAIPKNQLENKDRTDTVDKIIQTFGLQSVEVVKEVLKKINRNDLVEKLSNTSPGEQGVILRRQPKACSPRNTFSLQTPTPPQTTSPGATTLPAPSKPTPLFLDPPGDKAQNISSKYKNIPYTVLIESGSPAVYQLTPKKEKIGPLTRMTLGKNNTKKNKTILLVGETGAGKSTLINTLVNYAMGVEWEDDVWFQIVEDEEEKKSHSGTQTSDVIVYQIFGFEGKTLPYSLTIIDTPGYRTTSGIEQDDIVSQRLFDLFQSKDGVHEINAVGLVMKASENRLSDRQRYIFDSVMSLFGKDMEKNIVALITHSDGVIPENVLKALKAANIKCAKVEDDEKVHFLFDNRQSKQKTKKNEDALKAAWEMTMNHVGEFADFLTKQSPQKLKTTVEVLRSRTRLTACINNLQERTKEIDIKQEEIQQTQADLKKHEEEMKNNEEFTEEVDEGYNVKQKVDLLETLNKTMAELQKDKDQLLEESFEHVVKLEQIALKVDAVSTYVHLDFLIEKMKEKGDTEKKRKLEEMKSQMDKDEGIKAALRYMFDRIREAAAAAKAVVKEACKKK